MLDLRTGEASDVNPLLTQNVPGLRAAGTTRSASSQGAAETQEEKTFNVLTVENGIRLTGVVISAGVVTWALQGAGILASILTSAPAWRHLDPLPVLAPDEEKPTWRDDDKNKEAKQEDDAASALWRRDSTPDDRGITS